MNLLAPICLRSYIEDHYVTSCFVLSYLERNQTAEETDEQLSATDGLAILSINLDQCFQN